MAFDDWMKSQGSAPTRKGPFDAPVPGKPVPKSGGIGEKPVAAPSPPPASAPAPKSAGSARHGQSTTHREGSFPEDFHGSFNYE